MLALSEDSLFTERFRHHSFKEAKENMTDMTKIVPKPIVFKYIKQVYNKIISLSSILIVSRFGR